MKNFLLALPLILLGFIVSAQDTITVQTFTFDSITTRRGVFQFPDSTHTFRKILMEYTLKCDPATTQDQYNCGEWDYLTYTNVWDHTGTMDSNRVEHPKYVLGSQQIDTLPISSSSPYSLYQIQQVAITIDSIISETSYSIGNAGALNSYGTVGQAPEGRIQFFYNATELAQAGIASGNIDAIRLKFGGANQFVKNFTIQMKNQATTSIENGMEQDGFTEVYCLDTQIDTSSWQNFYFKNPFAWDGTSGILVDISFTGKTQTLPLYLQTTQKATPVAVFCNTADHYLNIDGANYASVCVDTLPGLINDEITICFWQYGDPNIQPQSDYLFEAKNIYNRRVLGSHLPWSNGNVYWDAGSDGWNYDRIEKAAQSTEYAGKWNHWAMTKNTNTGYMRIYLNGQLWQFGTNKTLSMAGITKFNIGASMSDGGNYDGFIDDFAVFNVELPDTIISEIMNISIDNSHPYASNLVASFSFNEGQGYTAHDNSTTHSNAMLMGAPKWGTIAGSALWKDAQNSDMLPDIVFLQGDYLSHTDTIVYSETVYQTPMSIVEYMVGNHSAEPIDTLWAYLAGYQYMYDHTGQIIDSMHFASSTEIINQTLVYYEEPYEVIDRYEIGRFITPYGIGLDLGPEGFTWVYDVTDYAHLLNGDVDISAGNQQELLDLTFVMIEGTPPRNFVELTRPWGQRGGKKYSSLDGDISLQNKTIHLNPQASTFKMKTRLTGHGHNSNDGSYPHCCEWKDNTHYLLVNGDTLDNWHIWETFDCAQNPVFPQGGTWPGAREGWCPGDKVKDYDFELTSYITSDSVDLDYDITDIPSTNLGMGNGTYQMAMHLFQYGTPNFTLDAEIVEVISPNDFGYHARKNPVCDGAEVIIRNSGATTLTSLLIKYNVSGGTTEQYTWTGSLEFMEKTSVMLPVPSVDFWLGDGNNMFEVYISEPNNASDQYAHNNQYRVHYELPPVYDDNFVIRYMTNNIPGDNYYEIKDINGNIVASRYSADPTTMYYDTLDLAPGCYTFEFYDTGHDGLYYWAYSAQGSGSLRFKKIGGGTLKVFEPEFGYKLHHAFVMSESVAIHPEIQEKTIEVYPNPTSDILFVDLEGYSGKLDMSLVDITGKVVLWQQTIIGGSATETIYTNNTTPGIYMLRINGNEINYTKRIVIK